MVDNEDGRIDVYVFASLPTQKLLQFSLLASSTINFMGGCCKAGDAEKFLERNRKAVVIVECFPAFLPIAESLFGFLKENAIRYIVLCETAGKGFKMLNNGALDMMVVKPDDLAGNIKSFSASLATRINMTRTNSAAEKARIMKRSFADNERYPRVIAMGSSTGGTEALMQVMKEMPEDSPPILVVQHMPPVFTRLYAERMHKNCKISCWEAKDGDRLQKGLVLIAPGDKHMRIDKDSKGYFVRCAADAERSLHCPSVDVLFDSVAEVAKGNAVGVIMTGMGADGAMGILHMREKGAYTIGQDEASCVVYGMPKKAYEMGGICKQVPLDKIASTIMEHIQK